MVQGVQVSAPLGKFAAAVDVIEALGARSAFLTSFSQSPHGNEKAALHARPFTSLRNSKQPT